MQREKSTTLLKDMNDRIAKSKELFEEKELRVKQHFKRQESERLLLDHKLAEKMNQLQENNKRNLDTIRNKFAIRISKSLENARENYIEKESNNVSRLEGLKEKTVQRYENWVR